MDMFGHSKTIIRSHPLVWQIPAYYYLKTPQQLIFKGNEHQTVNMTSTECNLQNKLKKNHDAWIMRFYFAFSAHGCCILEPA